MWWRRESLFSFLFRNLTFNMKLTVHGYYSSCTLHGTVSRTGTRTGTGNNDILYYTMYCVHYTGTGTGTGNGCFLLCPSWSLFQSLCWSYVVGMSQYMDISPYLIHETGWHKGVKYERVREVIGIVNRIALQKAIHLITLPPCLLPGVFKVEQFSWPSRELS